MALHNNPDFKLVDFDQFRNEAGANYFVLSPQRWIEKTAAVGSISKSSRYGGTQMKLLTDGSVVARLEKRNK